MSYVGWNTKFRIANTLDGVTGSSRTGTQLDGVTKFTYEYGTGVQPIREVGRRESYANLEQKISLSGTIERFYTGSGILGFVRGTNETGSMSYFYLGYYPSGEVSGQPYEAVDRMKVTNYRTLSVPGGTLRKETLDFVGIRVWSGSLWV